MIQRVIASAFILVLFLAGPAGYAQQAVPTATVKLQELRQRLEQRGKLERAAAAAMAQRYGIQPRRVLPNGKVLELQRLDALGRPVFYITNNLDAADTVSTDEVWPGGSAGLNLTGSGMLIGLWDAGAVDAGHIDLVPRVSQGDSTTLVSDHSTHVAGTLIASGANFYLQARGMAYQASLQAYDWNQDAEEMVAAADAGLLVSNHSYGIAAGWLGVGGTPPDNWWWFGGFGNEDPNFGYYNEQARTWDEIAYYAPHYLIVKAAGNDRWDIGPEPGSGEPFKIVDQDGVELAVSTDAPPPDCGQDGYDCLPPGGVAKNILTVGAVDDVPGGYQALTGPSAVTMTGFSSWGPADDGRIKPDLVANGWMLFSTYPSYPDYVSAIGTSMAAPNVSGSLLLLQQHYAALNGGSHMRAATLKGLAIHTADESGAASGPDYEYGWGLLNTKAAARVISENGSGSHWIVEDSLGNGNTDTLVINIAQDGARVTATLVWHDPPATPVSPPELDPRDAMLVNDLDLRATRNGDIHYPWKLNVEQPAAPATRGDNLVDNVEQVEFEASAGNYTLQVSHKLALASPQDYSLLVSIAPPAPASTGLAIDEDFAEGVLPPGWSTWTTNVPWQVRLPGGGDARYNNNTGGSGGYAMLDNNWLKTVAALVMPPLDLSATESAVLRFRNRISSTIDVFESLNVDTSVDGGLTWNNQWSWIGVTFSPFTQPLDLTAAIAGHSNVRVRFRWDSGGYPAGDFWQLDDVELEIFGAAPPPPPPDPSGLPGLAEDPVPNNNSIDVSTDALLTWSSGPLADSHDVYLGTSSDLGIADHQANVDSNQFAPGPLLGNTTYFWRVDEVNIEGTTTGNTWSFTTGTAPEPPPAPQVHVADIDGFSTPQRRNRWEASATVRLLDLDGLPVSGAEVIGQWSDGATGTSSTTTDSNGVYTLAKGNLKAGVASVTLSITGVNLSGYDYMPGDNADPDGDSDGTTIVINRDGGSGTSNTPPVVTITAPLEGQVFSSGATVQLQAAATDVEDSDTAVTDAIVWRAGGSQIGSGGSATHVFASDGTYDISATSIDSDGASHTDNVNITVGSGGGGGGGGDAYVSSLVDVSTPLDSRRWSARGQVEVRDDGGPVAGATVNGGWSDGAKGGASCTTGADGRCILSKSVKLSVGSVLLTLDSVSVGGVSYPPGSESSEQLFRP